MGSDYRTTVLRDRPEFSGRLLFVADPEGPGVLLHGVQPVTVYIDPKTGKGEFKGSYAESLRGLGRQVFGWGDPSVPAVLSRLVTPEMEIERIFNCYRHKYVRSLASREQPREWVAERLTSCGGNDLFTALIGGTFRGDTGGVRRQRVLAQHGFGSKPLPENFDTEAVELQRAVRLLLDDPRESNRRDGSYRELLAIKPGFHERWYLPQVHVQHNKDVLCEAMRRKEKHQQVTTDLRRAIVLLSFHGVNNDEILDLKTVRQEMSRYRQFSQCHATEGPCFARKCAKVDLRDALPGAARADASPDGGHETLRRHCWVYDYREAICEDQESISNVLKRMEKFTAHDLRWSGE